ncbi:hypothetical protein [Henriciella sp.]|uniref:hypothetical protein n=1 Tax=Henriciella sp. TaxID=1968823 RepID=UPI002631DFA5|nr:hypothetical protein [Henriciella sp.]
MKFWVSAAAVAVLPVAAHADGEKGTWDNEAVGTRYSSEGTPTNDRVLTDEQVRDIINRSGANGPGEVRYMGGSKEAVDTELCCENVEERVTEKTEVEETTTYFDAVTRREITQPVERTIIQPVERRIIRPQTENVTAPVRYEENRLPKRVEADKVPAIQETVVEDVTVEEVEEATESYYDVVTQREIIQPIERTTIVPVKRRILRPVTETVTAETRYETRRAPLVVEKDPVPPVKETVTEEVNEVVKEEVTETYVDAVTQKNVFQPVVKTDVQPIERRILRPQSETVTADRRYEEERLPLDVRKQPAPRVTEKIIPKVTERTVLEVQDEYIDHVTRNVIQPVVSTTVQPVERRVLRPQTERVTAETRYEQERLPKRVEAEPVPETHVNHIEQVEEKYREEVTETYFDAVTKRKVIQPVTRRIIQPVEYRKPRPVTETVEAPTRYETRRASLVVLNVGSGCPCN